MKMMNKRGNSSFPWNKVIIAFLCLAVILIIVYAAIKFNLPGWAKEFVGFNQTQEYRKDLIVEAEVLGENVKVLTDDGQGRIKPLEGQATSYGVRGGKLEYWDGKNWNSVEDKIATEDKIWLKSLFTSMLSAISKANIDFEKKQYDVSKLSQVDFNGEKINLLAAETADRKLIIRLEKDYQGEIYGIGVVETTTIREGKKFGSYQLYSINKDKLTKGSNDWKIVSAGYLYVIDKEWQGMLWKKQLKEDLLKAYEKWQSER